MKVSTFTGISTVISTEPAGSLRVLRYEKAALVSGKEVEKVSTKV